MGKDRENKEVEKLLPHPLFVSFLLFCWLLGARSLAPVGGAGSHRYSTYEFLPFGGGNRRCIGYALALLEMKLVLAKILTGWDLSLTSDHTIRPKRRGATIAPDNGVPLIVNGKRSQVRANKLLANQT